MITFGIWKKLKEAAEREGRPLFVLAPLANVTDAAFRRLIASRSHADALWTEFVSADGLALADKVGRDKLLRDLVFSKAERPIVAQFFTATPEHMQKAAELATQLGFDAIDINMGCPDRAVEKQGAGAALMKNPARARELIRAAKAGASTLPVSVKTRLGLNKNELETWLPELLAEEPALVTIHARTRKEMSKVAAHWDQVKRAVEIRDQVQAYLPKDERTLIFGNGDVTDLADARTKATETGADGVMFGRAIFGNPWLFSGRDPRSNSFAISPQEKIKTLIEHIHLFDQLLGDLKSFAIMKKHFKAYITGWPGAAELRAKLMETTTATEALALLAKF